MLTLGSAQTQIKAVPVVWGDSCLVEFSVVTPDTVLILFYKNLQGQTVTPGTIQYGNCSAYISDFCRIEKLKNHA